MTRPNCFSRARLTARVAAPLALCAAALLSGCAASGPSESTTLYQTAQYAQAYERAQAEHAKTSGPARDRAALTAGLSAYELKRFDDADRWLRPLATSADDDIAGRAAMTMGLTEVARDRYSLALTWFNTASDRLDGNNKARAHFYAGECLNQMGQTDAAQRSYQLASAVAEDAALKSQLASRMVSPNYCVQLGSFSSWHNAQRTADTMKAKVRAAGLEAPRIVPANDVAGRQVYRVQAGSFKTREEAEAARAKVGGESKVVRTTG